MEIIRPLYKAHEPFQEVKQGYGYRGVILHNETKDEIQCHLCGKWFKALGSHIKSHDIVADDYCSRFGLNFNTPLCSTGVSKLRRELISDQFIFHKKSRPNPKRARLARPARHVGTATVAQQNKYGLCALQMKTRYNVVRAIVGKMPTQEQIREHDHALMSAIERRFKTLNVFRQNVGEKPMTVADYQTTPDIDLVAALRKKARIIKGIPKTRHFAKAIDGFPFYGTILKRFGGWSTALRIAGII